MFVDLPVSEARHLALSPLARRLHGPRAARCLARRDRRGPLGGLGALRRAGPVGRRLRPLLLALRPRSTTARRACARGRRGSANEACSSAHALFHVAAVALLAAVGARARERRLLLARRRRGRGAPRSTSTRSCARAICDRLDAAFFTVNGVISVVFFVFVVLDTV